MAETFAQDATRDFVLALDGRQGEPPLLSIVGGKITTYRHVAEEALKMLAFPHARAAWTRGAPLPGGNFGDNGQNQLAQDLATAVPHLGRYPRRNAWPGLTALLARAIVAGIVRPEDLGIHFGAGLYEREVMHLVDNEWAMTTDDILWRRTKLGLRLNEQERGRLSDWLSARTPSRVSSAN